MHDKTPLPERSERKGTFRTFQEHDFGKPRRLQPTRESRRSGLRRLAGWIVGPVAVEPDHAELDAVAEAREAAILDDGIIHRARFAVADQRGRRAIAPRDVVGLPGPEGELVHPVVAGDLQRRVPERALLVGKARGDLAQGPFAGRQVAVKARAGQPEILLQRIGRLRRLGEREQAEHGGNAELAKGEKVAHGPSAEVGRSRTVPRSGWPVKCKAATPWR